MPHITVLQKEISELIAAGEVIERPASVIKELVENAIDACASHITVEIQNGGTTYMRIVDDGCGMASEEVPTAFLRHATSKITGKEDLNSIFTLGFRGEALASIAAVSRVTILTKQKEDAYGTRYTIEGDIASELEQTGCPNGTTLVIRDLFYNVPVRRKFMKRDVTEANAVSHIVQKIALSHPEIAFRMIRDNRTEFRTDGSGDLYAALYAVLGKEFVHDMMPVSYEGGMYKVEGYAGKPLYARSNRSFQNFFVNGRYVHSKSCSVALESAYQNLIMSGKFPSCVLMLSMPPAQLDVNIHPAKAEVRFSDEKAVMDSVFFAVKNALMQNGLIYEFQMERVPQRNWTEKEETPETFLQPSLPVTKEKPDEIASPAFQMQQPETSMPRVSTESIEPEHSPSHRETAVPLSTVQTAFSIPKIAVEDKSAYPDKAEPETVSHYEFLTSQAFETRKPAERSVSTEQPEKPEENIRVIGEVFRNYILAELNDQLLIFDKHAAHERVIFERLRSGATKQTSQMLLRETVTILSMDEFSAVQDHQDKLAEMGFSFDCTSPPRLKTLAVPSFVLDLNMDEVITEIAHNLALGKADPQIHTFHDMLHTIACKSAIRAGDSNDLRELQKLAQEVWNNENIRHCPHGRPVMFVVRKYDLEKQFRRT